MHGNGMSTMPNTEADRESDKILVRQELYGSVHTVQRTTPMQIPTGLYAVCHGVGQCERTISTQ